MKNKFLVMLLAVSMAAGSVVPVFAEAETEETAAAEVQEINFDDITPAYEGVWIDFEDAFSVYVPEDWTELDISEEDQENGIFYAIVAPDGSGWNMNVNYTEIGDQAYTTEQIAQELAAVESYTDIELLVLNGMEAVSLQTVDNTALIICFPDEAGGMYTMAITGDVTNADFTALAGTMGASVGIYEDDAADETEAETE
ncbi:MAG: hypothetical protein Q4B01_10375 [Eubacteriales bacterium]|nr:hypothetical protein [Eubacteriales bacterium]